MVRLAVIGVLFLSVFLMIRGISETWKGRFIPESEMVPKAVSQKQDSVVSKQPGEQLHFNPVVPAVLPDFNSSYLFNEERKLEDEQTAKTEEAPVEHIPMANDLGITTDIEGVTYSGSIIGENFKIAIISYTPDRRASEAEAKTKKTDKKSASRRRPTRTRTPTRATTEYARIKEGDLLSGYLVAAIEPEKIVFRKGQEAPVEKFMYDPDKKRVTPARSSQSLRSPVTPRPRPTGATGTRTGATTPTGEKILKVKSNLPSRQNITTRQPPPKPDTSRVSRRRRSTVTPPSGLPTIPPALQQQ